MPYLLAKLKNVTITIAREFLEKDKPFHEKNNMFLENIWQNADDDNEVLFIFRIKDIVETKALIHKLHSEALATDANANLPEMTYLK
ncbi:hypothetical protein [Flavobacterium glaciei]|uniref:Uncharacterized protein n=1 Tax=Flavobacterium glaciei TaxID=386300 RepID=A0A562Q1W8_9FLAO|nr:hypothetical protein [Flavobacterium glaciei]RDI57556.1 hypothetical protein DFR66_102172 [Flavobacterium glaciei]TWI50643.1 hypothetical protein IQ02_00545 [Flavobacterium glaciei]